jgi:SNF2 family DNA or RNA helicase
MIRRLKKDVLKELPDKRRQKIEVTVDKKIQTEINKILNGFGEDPSSLLKTQLQQRG